MPKLIDQLTYYQVAEVAAELGVSRQTLWRWRQEGRVPAGHRFRDRQVLFTESEVQAIREFALKVEPITAPNHTQLKLFTDRGVS
jgi:excisionase family DNA binding protein